MGGSDIFDTHNGDWASSVPHSRKRRFAREAGIFIYSGKSMICCNLHSFYKGFKRNNQLPVSTQGLIDGLWVMGWPSSYIEGARYGYLFFVVFMQLTIVFWTARWARE